MSKKKIKKIFFLAPALLIAGCPEQVGQQCPPHTVSVAQLSLGFTGEHDAGECTTPLPDGGALALALDAGGTRNATICFGSAADGGPQLHLIIPTKGDRISDLLDDGGFRFAGSSTPVVGTACDPADGGACAVAIDEVFTGNLQAGAAGFAVQPDGGLPAVTGLTGSLVDKLTSSDTRNCVCALPCTVTYSIAGTRF